MRRISDAIEQIIQENPFLGFGFHHGLLNDLQKRARGIIEETPGPLPGDRVRVLPGEACGRYPLDDLSPDETPRSTGTRFNTESGGSTVGTVSEGGG